MAGYTNVVKAVLENMGKGCSSQRHIFYISYYQTDVSKLFQTKCKHVNIREEPRRLH